MCSGQIWSNCVILLWQHRLNIFSKFFNLCHKGLGWFWQQKGGLTCYWQDVSSECILVMLAVTWMFLTIPLLLLLLFMGWFQRTGPKINANPKISYTDLCSPPDKYPLTFPLVPSSSQIVFSHRENELDSLSLRCICVKYSFLNSLKTFIIVSILTDSC